MNNLPDPDKVVFKHSLYKFKTENDIGTIIIQKVQLLGDLKKFKFCPEFLLYICNLTEHLVGDNKFDKKKIAINIISSLFNLNINETELVSNSIEFLHSNNLIKKVFNCFHVFYCIIMRKHYINIRCSVIFIEKTK